MLWTSITTGKRPYKHGIRGFVEPTPDGTSVQPVTGLSRKTKAIWNILNQQGKRCHVVGWWPSHPAEPVNGVMVSNHHRRAPKGTDPRWPMAPGTVHSARLAEELAGLRVHPRSVTSSTNLFCAIRRWTILMTFHGAEIRVLPTSAGQVPKRHPITVQEYFRMGLLDVLAPEARVELIEGEIIIAALPGMTFDLRLLF